MKVYYEIFGLILSSDWVLPRLKEVAGPRSVDVEIKRATINTAGISNATVTYPSLQIAPDSVWLSVDQVGRFLVTKGELIEVDAEVGADMQSVSLYVLGSCLAAIIHQRKQFILHGNAIDVGGQALVFVGAAGIGKSTLAACFYKKGYKVLADDLAVINDANKVLPSYPQIKLWSDAIKHLELESIPGTKRIRLHVDKFEIPIADQFQTEPVRVHTIYLLRNGNVRNTLLEEIRGVEKISTLQKQVFRRKYVQGMRLTNTTSTHCVRLSLATRIVRITRPEGSFEPDRLMQLALEDYWSNGGALLLPTLT